MTSPGQISSPRDQRYFGAYFLRILRKSRTSVRYIMRIIRSVLFSIISRISAPYMGTMYQLCTVTLLARRGNRVRSAARVSPGDRAISIDENISVPRAAAAAPLVATARSPSPYRPREIGDERRCLLYILRTYNIWCVE